MKFRLTVLLLLVVYLSNGQGHGNEQHYFHHVAVFNGVTTQLEDPTYDYTLGLEYVFSPRNWEHWSLGSMVEVIFRDNPEWVIAMPFIYEANDRVWLRFGIGLELYRDVTQHLEIYKLPLIRIGGGYSFHWKFLSISPSMDIDIVRNHPAFVAGLTIGYAF